ncbi:hypothetical protein ACXR6G_08765 [Ancylomarina sp. YFZ004]
MQNRLLLSYSLIHCRVTDWIISTIEFYDRLAVEADFVDKFKVTKITHEKIAADQQAIHNLNELRNEAIAEKGGAQETTRQRNKKIEALEDFCYELKTLAKIALEDQSQYFNTLRFLVYLFVPKGNRVEIKVGVQKDVNQTLNVIL